MTPPKRRPVKRENLALKQVNQMLEDVNDKQMEATIKKMLNKLTKSSIEKNVGPLPRKRPKEDADSFGKRVLNFLMRRGPGNKDRKFESREGFMYKAKGGMVTKKGTNDMRKTGMFKGGYSTKKK